MSDEQLIDAFLHIADLHFWRVTANPLRLLNKRALGNLNVWLRRRHEFVVERLSVLVPSLRETGVDTILMTGDFSSTSLDEEFQMASDFVCDLEQQGFRPIVMPGNHDVYTFESVRKRRFEHVFAKFLPKEGFPCKRSLHGGTSIVVVPTVCPNIVSSKGRVLQGEVRRVAELLASCSGPVVVAGHYPLLTSTDGYYLTRERRLQNAEILRHAIGETGKRILYVCGHVHRFSYTKDPDYPNLEHLSTGAFFRTARETESQGEFSEVHVLADGFEVVRHRLMSDWRRERMTPTAGRRKTVR